MWYLDYGAIQHMKLTKNWFISYFKLGQKKNKIWRDDDSYEIARKGVVIFKLEDGSKRHVENIYHILSLKKKTNVSK
jgi:hypothetical protein